MTEFKVGDEVRVMFTKTQLLEENCYSGIYGLNDKAKILKIKPDLCAATLEKDIGVALNIKLSSLELVKIKDVTTIKAGDTVKVIKFRNYYNGIYNYGTKGKVASVINGYLRIEGESEYCMPVSCVELVEPAVQYKNPPKNPPNKHLYEEWLKGADIQFRNLSRLDIYWSRSFDYPITSTFNEYRIDPACIIKPEYNKARKNELLEIIQVAKDELQSME